LPAWTPGSYLIREYARHLGRVRAFDARTGGEVPCRKNRKNRFAVEVPASVERLRITYEVYAHELTVRTSDLTDQHAYWNHACVLLWPVGDEARSARIRVDTRPGWQVACSLPRDAAAPAGEAPGITLLARDLHHAIDSPFLAGRLDRLDFTVDGVPHALVLDGLAGVRPPATLVADISAIVADAQAVFSDRLPYESYLFLCLFAADGHGGLEHAESSTLLMSRTALASDKGYREFLGLAAHEVFHAWNGKRLRPAEFWTYDYEVENHTEMLWLIEGWTAYYDDLLCVRAGVMSRTDYLAVIARNVESMRAAPGRHRASLRESSFDAWIRLYRPDENTRNSSQNYYVNGSVAALCLDLWLRARTGGVSSLDCVLRDLWARTFRIGRGYELDDVHAVLREHGGEEAVVTLEHLVGGDLDPDVESLIAPFGCRAVHRDADQPQLGVTFQAGGTVVASVTADSAAHAGGIAPGDEVLGLQGLRVDADRWSDVFQATATAGEPIDVLVARRGVLTTCRVRPSPSRGKIGFEFDKDAPATMLAMREAWLGSLAKASLREPGAIRP
jgi:predicted metalloprotease with PDZ domain